MQLPLGKGDVEEGLLCSSRLRETTQRRPLQRLPTMYSSDSLDGLLDGTFIINVPCSGGESDDDLTIDRKHTSEHDCNGFLAENAFTSNESYSPKGSNVQQVDELKYFERFLGFFGLWPKKGRVQVASIAIGLFFIVIFPLCSILCIQPTDDATEHQLPFRMLVFVIESSLAIISFVFLHINVYRNGLRGLLFFKYVQHSSLDVREDFLIASKKSYITIFGALFLGFLGHLILQFFLFSTVPLEVRFLPNSNFPILRSIVVLESVAWMYKTVTFLWSCVIFWKVCKFQVLQILKFIESVRNTLKPYECFIEYQKISGIQNMISKTFRLFLSLVGVVTVMGSLASLYEIVLYRDAHISVYNGGTVFLANLVAIFGMSICLRAASKIAHLHKKVIHAASLMHAENTLDESVDRHSIDVMMIRQDEWHQRAALVSYLSTSKAGISVYGFVLDRALVHTTLGALLTTMWFIVGRSLSSPIPLGISITDE